MLRDLRVFALIAIYAGVALAASPKGKVTIEVRGAHGREILDQTPVNVTSSTSVETILRDELAEVKHITPTITPGGYLVEIDGDSAQPDLGGGWCYQVNYTAPDVGMRDYPITANQSANIFIFYGHNVDGQCVPEGAHGTL